MERERIVKALDEIGFTPVTFMEATQALKRTIKAKSLALPDLGADPTEFSDMMMETHPEINEVFCRTGGSYALVLSSMEFISKYIDSIVGSGPARYLECGCSTGTHLLAFGLLYQEGDITFYGYDSNGNMAGYGAKKAKKMGLEKKVKIHKKAMTHTELQNNTLYGPGSFDLVVCDGSLDSNDLHKYGRSIADKVKNRGRLLYIGGLPAGVIASYFQRYGLEKELFEKKVIEDGCEFKVVLRKAN